jgi:hypothetical protein
MKHLIQKQQFLLAVPPGVDAFRMQHAASRFYREQLLPALEKIFDELSGDLEVIHLDQCVIDLGSMGAAVLESGFIDEALYRLLRAELRRAIERELARRPGMRVGVREKALARWWYYMEHGRLPWNTDRLTEGELRQVLELFSVDYPAVSRLRTALTREALFLMRVAAQHEEWFLENLLTVLSSARQEGIAVAIAGAAGVHRILEKIYRQLEQGALTGPVLGRGNDEEIRQSLRAWAGRMAGFLGAPEYEQRSVLWRRLLVEAAERPAEFAVAGGGAMLMRDIPLSRPLMEAIVAEEEVKGDAPFLQELRRRIKDGPVGSGKGGSNARKEGQSKGGRLPAGSTEADQEAPEPVRGDEELLSEETDTLIAASGMPDAGVLPDEGAMPVESVLREEETVFKREEVTEEGIYVGHAGLILTNPFLSTLFHRLGLWDGAAFASLEARQRAVLLLYYLSTGEDRGPEYALVFPKLLCGYALEMPMPGELVLTAGECAEADVLLENVVLRWEKLGNTSIAGLREGFLQRNGKLTDRAGRLTLQVEASAIDVLLDYLSWNISLVKLPWLKDILYVDWR